jgi:hypothetical protein
MTLSSVGIAIASMLLYAFFPIGKMVGPDLQRSFAQRKVGVYVHVFFSALSLLVGPIQFIPSIRSQRPHLHRLVGRLYLGLLVPVGAVSSLFLSLYSQGGWPAHVGFFLLSVSWFITGALAFYTAAVKRDFVAHRRWAIRNYALTFAAVTLRVYLGISFAVGLGFNTSYPVIAWICWVPNLIVTETFILRNKV